MNTHNCREAIPNRRQVGSGPCWVGDLYFLYREVDGKQTLPGRPTIWGHLILPSYSGPAITSL